MLDGGPYARLHEDEVGDRDAMMGIDVAGERGERAVRHADRYGRHVLERIRHREEQDVHGGSKRGARESFARARQDTTGGGGYLGPGVLGVVAHWRHRPPGRPG